MEPVPLWIVSLNQRKEALGITLVRLFYAKRGSEYFKSFFDSLQFPEHSTECLTV